MSETTWDAPTLEGRALVDLGAQVAALRAENARLREAVQHAEATLEHTWRVDRAARDQQISRAERAEAERDRLRAALVDVRRMVDRSSRFGRCAMLALIDGFLHAPCPAYHGTGTSGERTSDGAPLVCTECQR